MCGAAVSDAFDTPTAPLFLCERETSACKKNTESETRHNNGAKEKERERGGYFTGTSERH